jgi:hypothetical protein
MAFFFRRMVLYALVKIDLGLGHGVSCPVRNRLTRS